MSVFFCLVGIIPWSGWVLRLYVTNLTSDGSRILDDGLGTSEKCTLVIGQSKKSLYSMVLSLVYLCPTLKIVSGVLCSKIPDTIMLN